MLSEFSRDKKKMKFANRYTLLDKDTYDRFTSQQATPSPEADNSDARGNPFRESGPYGNVR